MLSVTINTGSKDAATLFLLWPGWDTGLTRVTDGETEQGPRASPPPCPQPAFCLWKNFSQKIKFNQRSEKMQKQRKTVKGDQIIIV